MIATLLAAALFSGAAQAEPFMWGAGPTISTMVLPGQHPLSWPQAKKVDGERPAIGVYGDNDSGRLSEPYFEKVRGDVALGGRGVMYLNRDWRGGMRGQFGFGNNYRSSQLTLEVDKVIGGESGAFAFVGGGVGIGSMRFNSAQDDAFLKARNYPLRGHVGGYYKINGKAAIELSLFAQLALPSFQTLTTAGGDEIDMGVGVNPLSYSHIGAELTAYFGDFTPPKGGKKGKKGKKGKRR